MGSRIGEKQREGAGRGEGGGGKGGRGGEVDTMMRPYPIVQRAESLKHSSLITTGKSACSVFALLRFGSLLVPAFRTVATIPEFPVVRASATLDARDPKTAAAARSRVTWHAVGLCPPGLTRGESLRCPAFCTRTYSSQSPPIAFPLPTYRRILASSWPPIDRSPGPNRVRVG